jgi:glycosyltransferase involved in cell wall biosynthesis
VVITSNYKSVEDYIYENVKVFGSAKIKDIKKKITEFKPDAILVHFALGRIIKHILTKDSKTPTIIWVHGYEALGWYRRLFNFDPLVLKTYYKLLSLIFRNTIQLYFFRQLIKFANHNKNIDLVFVSEWMKGIAAKDCLIKINNSVIIGNPIDDSLFYYLEKNENMRFNILMIRPFNSKKYGTYLVTEALIILRKNPIFENLNFTIVGKDAEKSKLFSHFRDAKNVIIKGTFLDQKSIKALHDQHGVFLAISRQDAQGVSMCEAMSSGLAIISSNNTAIPEFIPDYQGGLLSNNTPSDIANKILEIIENKALFLKLSKQGSEFIRKKVGFESIINQELNVINKSIKRNDANII